MANIGKRLLSVFAEVEDGNLPEHTIQTTQTSPEVAPVCTGDPDQNEKFKSYFDRLFQELNLPGPDYYEFSKMVDAMASIAEERTRFISAFAGLTVQGLSKEKLLQSAQTYLQLLEEDFRNSALPSMLVYYKM